VHIELLRGVQRVEAFIEARQPHGFAARIGQERAWRTQT
jgi:hypothetical protein